LASFFLGISVDSDADDDFEFFGDSDDPEERQFFNPQQKGAALQDAHKKVDIGDEKEDTGYEATGDETEADEGNEAHEVDTLGNGEHDFRKQQEDALDFWNKIKADAPMKAGTDVDEGPSVGNDGS
jgi:hypothetical protein